MKSGVDRMLERTLAGLGWPATTRSYVTARKLQTLSKRFCIIKIYFLKNQRALIFKVETFLPQLFPFSTKQSLDLFRFNSEDLFVIHSCSVLCGARTPRAGYRPGRMRGERGAGAGAVL